MHGAVQCEEYFVLMMLSRLGPGMDRPTSLTPSKV
jgi:hypothetical protein